MVVLKQMFKSSIIVEGNIGVSGIVVFMQYFSNLKLLYCSILKTCGIYFCILVDNNCYKMYPSFFSNYFYSFLVISEKR